MVHSFQSNQGIKRLPCAWQMEKLLEQISGEEALKILRFLSAQDQDIENRIEELAENILKDIDLEDVSGEVFFDLNNIDVHDLWDQSGAISDR
jgi:hypothetical protein